MYQIEGLTADAKQTVKLTADGRDLVTLTLEYCEQQRGWWYSIDYLDFSVSQRRLVASPNTLRQFRNIIPFGLLCNVSDGQEPVLKDDFATGRVKLYVLNAEDIASAEDFILS